MEAKSSPLPESHIDPRHCHPRELVRGLMRGNRAESKLGYTATNAVLAVFNVQPDAKHGATELQAYAEGFAAGMAEDSARTLPGGVESDAEHREDEESEDVTKPFRELIDQVRDQIAEKFTVDRRVRSKINPSITGTIIEVDLTRVGLKPITVRRDDGRGLAYFHVDQLDLLPDREEKKAAEMDAERDDPRLSSEFHREVVTQLNGMGLRASYEFPGFVKIDRGDGTTLNTGQHGWDYGSIDEADGTPQGETQEIEIDGDDALNPRAVAMAWYEAIEGVSPVPGITPAQIRAIATSVENMNRGAISGQPVSCVSVDVRTGAAIAPEEDTGEGVGDTDALAVFSYQPADNPAGQTPGREETCFARNGVVKWSQDYG